MRSVDLAAARFPGAEGGKAGNACSYTHRYERNATIKDCRSTSFFPALDQIRCVHSARCSAETKLPFSAED